jgi:hypothetical protein
MTMNDDDLILHYYQDGLSDADRLRIRSALEQDASLRERYDRLCADLAEVAASDPVAAPADMVARWHDSVDRAARLEAQVHRPARSFHLPSFAWGGAVAAALVLGFGIYLVRDRTVQPIPGSRVAVSGVTVDRSGELAAFERGLQVHLQESRQEIDGLPSDADSERVLLIMRMVQENRLFETAAEHNGAGDLARLLRAFEPILMRLASQDISPAEAQALQAQLTFEVNVTRT